VLDDLRGYLQIASGLTEATSAKARDVVTGLLTSGLALTSRAMPAPDMVGQVQELADELVATSKSNRDMLTGMIRAEVDRAVGRMGFVREDELAALRRHVQRIEAQVAELEQAAAAVVVVEQAAPADDAGTQTSVDAPAGETGAAEADAVVEAVVEAPAVKPKKKKILLDPPPGHEG
jgi:polyhydroxyalkanoate synthesis regulator phasin